MTQPPNPEKVNDPELVGLGAEALVDNAKRLGLTWTLRPATVTDITDPVNGLVIIAYDGDEGQIGATSLIGALSLTDRVMGLVVPPSANFVVGLSTSVLRPYAPERGVVGSHVEVVNDTGITAVSTIMTTDQVINFRVGRAYEFCFAHSHFSSVAGTLVQYTVDLLNGGLAMHMGNYPTEGASSTGVYHSKIAVCSSDVSDQAILTAAAVSNNISILGSSSAPREFWVRDAGPASLYVNFPTF